MRYPALTANRRELQEVLGRKIKFDLERDEVRVDAATLVEVSSTFLHQCTVYCCVEGHTCNVLNNIGEYAIEDVPELQKICARLVELTAIGSEVGVFKPEVFTEKERRENRRFEEPEEASETSAQEGR